MGVIQFVRHFLLWLKYRKAAVANNRDELEDALRRMPPRIVVEGDEALRAYAATLTFREGEHQTVVEDGPNPPPGSPPVYLVVPTVGRIRDGYRPVKRPPSKNRRRVKPGFDYVLVAVVGIVAALLMEVLSIPKSAPELVRGPAHSAATLLRNGVTKVALPTRAAPPPTLGAWIVWALIPLLGLIAAASIAWLIWQASGLGRPIRTLWRVEYRVQGRLVMARVRKRTA